MKRGDLTVLNGRILHSQVIPRGDIDRRLAWTHGEFSFNHQPFNPFVHLPLVIADPSVADVSVEGVFQTDDPHLAERLIIDLEQHGQVRRIPQLIPFTDRQFRLVAATADPAIYGRAEDQLDCDVCASYQFEHEAEILLFADDANRKSQLDIVPCDLHGALAAFYRQSGVNYYVMSFVTEPLLTHRVRGNYRATEALAAMFAQTSCSASGDALLGMLVECRPPIAVARGKRM